MSGAVRLPHRGWLFDLDGTVYRGEALVPGADATIAALRADGRRVAFLSNKPLETRADYARKLTRRSLYIAKHQQPKARDDRVHARVGQLQRVHRHHREARVRKPLADDFPLRDCDQGFGLVDTQELHALRATRKRQPGLARTTRDIEHGGTRSERGEPVEQRKRDRMDMRQEAIEVSGEVIEVSGDGRRGLHRANVARADCAYHGPSAGQPLASGSVWRIHGPQHRARIPSVRRRL